MVSYSPFVRVERVLRWKREFWQYNTGSAEQNTAKTFTKGISITDSNSFWASVGISLTVDAGVEFLGIGGGVSATVSQQFGYELQHSVTEFSEQATTVTINIPAGKVAAAWQANSEILVKLHNPQTNQLELARTIQMPDSLDFVTDDYPD